MKKTFLKIAIGIGSIFALLVIILAVHIYLVTPEPEQNPTQGWQLSRIDINEELPLSDKQVKEINNSFKSVKGVERVVINKEHGTVVFAYFPKEFSAMSIYNNFSTKTGLNTALFTPSKEQLAASCPVIDKNSISYKMGSFFQNIFQN